MNLKKSDKIIAIVAVIILIIAAIGVILYTDKEPEKVEPVKEKMLLYNVEINEMSQSVELDNTVYSMTDKKPYTGTFIVTCDNLKDVGIYVEYKDNDRGLFKNSRKNTITVAIYDENENEVCPSKQIKGDGNETLNIPGSNPLNFDQIIARDINDANEKLEENLSESNTGLSKTYKIEITVKYGEIRILKKLFERLGGDSFTIELTESHYDYKLVEQEQDNDDDNDNISEESLNPMVPTYRALGYPGFH